MWPLECLNVFIEVTGEKGEVWAELRQNVKRPDTSVLIQDISSPT